MAASRTQEGAALMDEPKDVSKEKSSRAGGYIDNIRNFWHEVVLEMKKVSWPTRQEVINTTLIVVIAIFFFAAYLFVADIALSYTIKGLEWAASKIFG
jgi:preprotein translocase subunit SecE